jgi:hypothetical protein
MTFQKGVSGNPLGRPRGARSRSAILTETLMSGDIEAITKAAVDLAKDGDIGAIRLCLDRLCPRPKDRPVPFKMPRLTSAADAADAMGKITRAVAAGELTPGEAEALTKVVHAFTQTLIASDFEARLAAMERRFE